MCSDEQFKGHVPMRAGRQYLQEGEYAHAVMRFLEAIKAGLSRAETAEAHFLLGKAHLGLRNWALTWAEHSALKGLDELLAEELHNLIIACTEVKESRRQ